MMNGFRTVLTIAAFTALHSPIAWARMATHSEIGQYYELLARRDESLTEFERQSAIAADHNSLFRQFLGTADAADQANRAMADLAAQHSALVEQIRRTGGGLEVVEHLRFAGHVRTVPLTEAVVRTPVPIFFEREYHFFQDDLAFDEWTLEHPDSLGLIVGFYTGRDPYLRRCMNEHARGSESVSVDTRLRTHCGSPVGDIGDNVNYRISRGTTGISVWAQFAYQYAGPEEFRQTTLNRIYGQFGCVRRFYARQGIDLHLGLAEATDPTPFATLTTDGFVLLNYEVDHGDSTHWGSHRDRGRDITAAEVCSVLVHEIGHRLGLPDTYRYDKASCPGHSEPIGPEWDIMRFTPERIEEMWFQQHHRDSIVSPLCGERRSNEIPVLRAE